MVDDCNKVGGSKKINDMIFKVGKIYRERWENGVEIVMRNKVVIDNIFSIDI